MGKGGLFMCLRFLFVPLLFSSACYADLHMNPKLIRQWSQDLENEYPGNKPAIAHFKKQNYELFYLAATHETNLKSPTLRLVEQLLKKDVDVLLVEPFSNSAGQSPTWALNDAIKGLKKGYIVGGESALAILRANAKKIPFFGGEPDHRQIFQALKSRGYSDLDIVGLYVVRQIPQWIRERKDKNQLLEKNVKPFVEIYCQKFPVKPCPSLYDIRTWYKLKNERELTANVPSSESDPLPDGRLVTQRISAAINDVRDRFTLNVIENLLNRYHRVAVIYGSGHFTTLRKSLETALGQPTFETD